MCQSRAWLALSCLLVTACGWQLRVPGGAGDAGLVDRGPPADDGALDATARDAPADTLDAPADGVDAFADTFDAPADTLDAPADAFDAPADTFDAPADTFDAPADTFDAPADGFDAPADTFDAPGDVGAEPSTPLDAACGTVCGAECVSLETDPNNCGTCGNRCTAGSTCACCPRMMLACPVPGGGARVFCADTSRDPNNCGFCGNNCPAPRCVDGICM